MTEPPRDGAPRADPAFDTRAIAFANGTAVVDSEAPSRTWRAALGEALFVPVQGAGRHRPADALVVVVGVVFLGFTASRIQSSTSLEVTFAELVNGLPDGLAGLAGFLYRLGALWFVGLAAAAVAVGGQRRLAASVVVAGSATWLLGRALVALGGKRRAMSSIVVRYGHVQTYPLVRVAVVVAVLTASSPYLTVFARRVGFGLALLVSIMGVYLGVGLLNDAVGGALLGLVVGSAVKFAIGSPAGRPTVEQIHRGLAEFGIAATDLRFDVPEDGITLLTGYDSGGLLHVKAYGRDERDTQLASRTWHFVWYSEAGPPLLFTRLQLVEHEAYVLLRATGADVAVPSVVAAATASSGTALLVTRPSVGEKAGSVDEAALTDALLASVWRALDGLHEFRIAHGALDLEHVLLTPSGAIELIGFGSSITSAQPTQLAADGARLLAASAVAVGADRAVDAARTGYARNGLAAMVPFLQLPVLTDPVRRVIRRERELLTRLRSVASAAAGVDVPEPAKLVRVNPRSLVTAAFTFLGVYLLLGRLATFADLGQDIRHLLWWWIALAVACSALTNVGFAAAYVGAAPVKLPFGSVIALQAAGAFTGLVTPGGFGTTAMNIRFLQVRGVAVASAAGASLVNSVASTVVNVALLLAVLPASRAKIDIGRVPWRGVVAVTLLVIAVVVLVGAALWRVPRVQRFYAGQIRPAIRHMIDVTRKPSKTALVLGGNLGVAILYGIALTAVCRAYGDDTGFTTVLFINIAVSYLTGLIPVPGGLGVAEAGLAAGLAAVGVLPDVAVGVSLTYRFITTWLPPLPGWFALHYLEREGDL